MLNTKEHTECLIASPQRALKKGLGMGVFVCVCVTGSLVSNFSSFGLQLEDVRNLKKLQRETLHTPQNDERAECRTQEESCCQRGTPWVHSACDYLMKKCWSRDGETER